MNNVEFQIVADKFRALVNMRLSPKYGERFCVSMMIIDGASSSGEIQSGEWTATLTFSDCRTQFTLRFCNGQTEYDVEYPTMRDGHFVTMRQENKTDFFEAFNAWLLASEIEVEIYHRIESAL